MPTLPSTCNFPFVTWQFAIIADLMILRVTLYIYCVADRFAKAALFCIYAIELPLLIFATAIGTVYYSSLSNECVSALLGDPSPVPRRILALDCDFLPLYRLVSHLYFCDTSLHGRIPERKCLPRLTGCS